METTETIPVYIDIAQGQTVCICHANGKGCDKPCPRDEVTRDRFNEWQKTLYRNKYGK